ncbi:MAG TPA: isocitrate lyase/phosphoenolpyruvate mutase family protein [Dehalococcoidia bacterium]|nr:isocitrate lyase/phosphoenolpyruvate mutase family protein [Dehalococcoidia bacterium]
MTNSIAGKATALRQLHAGPGMLVLPNAWDAASAKVLEAAGFPAIATTSGGVANALGYEDHQGAPASEMLEAAARISSAVSIPVTVDFEAGYGMAPDEIVERLIEVGAAGFNFEDSDHVNGPGLIDAEAQAERIAALKDAGRAAGVDLVLNARVDVYIQRQGTPEEQTAEGLRRALLYKDAGADCIYPIIQADEAILARYVAAVGAINVNLRPGGPLTLQRAAVVGVRRVSYATSLFRAAMTALEQAAAEIQAEAAVLP